MNAENAQSYAAVEKQRHWNFYVARAEPAGGIVSAAIDGERCADVVLKYVVN